MDIRIFDDKAALGAAAAAQGAEAIRQALAERGEANIIVATGASQFEVLDALVEAPGIDWALVSAFHLDEYAGIERTHPASFRRYLDERFTSRLPGLSQFVEVGGDAGDLEGEVRRLNGLIDGRTIDVCFAGIGENCHLAFNDPPADFDTRSPYIVVDLDEACRRQQLGEGWFATLMDVPTRAHLDEHPADAAERTAGHLRPRPRARPSRSRRPSRDRSSPTIPPPSSRRMRAARSSSIRRRLAPVSRDRRRRRAGVTIMITGGLFDLQVNGFAGIDFNDAGLTPDALDHALEAMIATGVTLCLPTLITADPATLTARFRALDAAVADSRLGPLMVPGYHLEGPFLNPAEGYAGCHPPAAMTTARCRPRRPDRSRPETPDPAGDPGAGAAGQRCLHPGLRASGPGRGGRALGRRLALPSPRPPMPARPCRPISGTGSPSITTSSPTRSSRS